MAAKSFIEEVQQKREANDKSSALSHYEVPLVTVDIVLFTVQENRLKVLLIQRKSEPFIHSWALPGGFIHIGEHLIEAAENRLAEETDVKEVYLQQLRAFGKRNRDPRGRVITVGFYALVSSEQLHPEAHANAESLDWHCVTELPELAFDHRIIVDTALNTLKDHLETTPIAYQLLPSRFTLTELQRVYELIEEKTLDKRNFRKKIMASGMLKDTGETKMEGYHRPAQLYAFADNELEVLQDQPV